jgi:hypothetical protein
MNNNRMYLITNIKNFDCERLDIGQRIGSTHYIDFIKESEVEHIVMKGIDYYKRFFIIIKAEYIFNDETKLNIYSTFFQRYTDNYLLWHCCGQMMDTTGGMNIKQFELVNNLLTNGYVDLDDDIINECYLKLEHDKEGQYKEGQYIESPYTRKLIKICLRK